MLKEDHESQKSQNLVYAGTIIDIETIGNYRREYPKHDSREYKDLKMVIFGYINKQEWHIYCAAGIKYIPELEEKAKQLLMTLRNERPLYAFNCHQEMGVFFHRLNGKILIDKELQSEEYERKEEALRKLGIVESYDDPFHTDQKPGKACMIAWENGSFDKAIQHNRACLLKEQAFLLHGRGIKPVPLDFKIEASSSASLNASFQPWTKEQENYVRKAWSDGSMLKTIAQDCKRTPNAIWMRLQRLKEIPAEIPYTIEKNSFTIRDLQR
jgi:hypothetical protein